MSNVTINVTKWYHFVLAIGSIIAMISGTVVWVDSRYIHRNDFELASAKAAVELQASENAREAAAAAAYEQSINLQWMIVQGRLEIYEQMIKDGKPFTANQTMNYNDYVNKFEFLNAEKNRLLMGLGVPE